MKLNQLHTPHLNSREVKPTQSLDERNKKAAESLSPRYDLLNQKWHEAEKKLKAMQSPRHVQIVYMEEDSSSGFTILHCLGLVKHRGEWRLCLSSHSNDEQQGPEVDWKPVIECAAEERVAAAPFILKLREEIVLSAEQFVAKVDDAVQKLTESLKQF